VRILPFDTCAFSAALLIMIDPRTLAV